MTKLAFTFFKEPDRLWVKVMQSKYFKETVDGFVPKNLTSQFVARKGLSRECQTMLRGAHLVVRNGRDTNFWTTKWVDANVLLLDWVRDDREVHNLEEKVVDYVDQFGQWELDRLSDILKPEALAMVIGMSPPKQELGEDQWV
ncbi:hypothetical protein LINPERHAP2_LOCUS20600 [Linum perenne]